MFGLFKKGHKVRASLVYRRSTKTYSLRLSGVWNMCGNVARVFWAMKKIRQSNHWQRLEVDFVALRTADGEGFGSDVIAVLIELAAIAIRRNAEWQLIFQSRAQIAPIISLYRLGSFFEEQLRFVKPEPMPMALASRTLDQAERQSGQPT
ncbi:MAG: hypothetical protein PHW95_03790 [Patescibacteria group bacterium]|nr:hypothetical protein [Patescibacteria group bacterium]